MRRHRLRRALEEAGRHRSAILIAYLLGLLFVTLAPLPSAAYELASVTTGSDKAVHFVLFGGFAALTYWNASVVAPRPAVTALGAAAVLAALVELLQGPLVYRSASLWDFVWGAVGGGVAVAALAAVGRR